MVASLQRRIAAAITIVIVRITDNVDSVRRMMVHLATVRRTLRRLCRMFEEGEPSSSFSLA